MKRFVQAAFAVLGLATAVAPIASAADRDYPVQTHQGPYDNTGNGPGQTGLEGGGG